MDFDTDTDIVSQFFQNTTQGKLSLDQMIFYIKSFLEQDPNAEYSLVIGTDSQEKINNDNEKRIHIITAIIVHRKGFGGRYFWKKKIKPQTRTLREKIYTETLTSLTFATSFVPLLKKSLNGTSPKYNLEIHIDVGEHGDTREMIKEVVGMITGSGFVAKTKPDAYGASYVADKHT